MIALAPLPKQSSGPRPYRSLAFLPALPVKLDKAVVDVRGPQLQGLGDPGPRVIERQKQEEVTSTGPSILVDGCEHSFDLLAGHKAQHPLGVLLLRDGQDALASGEEIDRSRLAKNEACKGANGGESKIARGGTIATGTLEVIQKGEDRLGSESGQGEAIDWAAVMLREKPQQEPEGGAVAGPRFGAEVTLGGKVIGEKPLHQARKLKGRHDDGSENEGTSWRRRAARPGRWKCTTRSN